MLIAKHTNKRHKTKSIKVR